ncbi:hypothetical protein PT2222_20182 [Paraburkholderia tropica]
MRRANYEVEMFTSTSIDAKAALRALQTGASLAPGHQFALGAHAEFGEGALHIGLGRGGAHAENFCGFGHGAARDEVRADFVFALREANGVGRDARIELRERMQKRSRMRDAPRGAGGRVQFEQRKQEVADVAKAVHLGERERRRIEGAFERDRMLAVARAAREHAFVRDERLVEKTLAEFARRNRADVAHHEQRAHLAANTREQRIAFVEAVVVERHHVGNRAAVHAHAAAADPFAAKARGHAAVDARAFDMHDVERHDFVEQQREARHEIGRADGFDHLAERLEREGEIRGIGVRGDVEQHGAHRKTRRIDYSRRAERPARRGFARIDRRCGNRQARARENPGNMTKMPQKAYCPP